MLVCLLRRSYTYNMRAFNSARTIFRDYERRHYTTYMRDPTLIFIIRDQNRRRGHVVILFFSYSSTSIVIRALRHYQQLDNAAMHPL